MLNPRATVFQPQRPTQGPSRLLALPVEIKERIMAYVLRPEHIWELALASPIPTLSRSAYDKLIQRLEPASACKELYNMAIRAYFLHTQLNAVIGKDAIQDAIVNDPLLQGVTLYLGEILSGTFEEHAFLFANTVKIRLELDQFDVQCVEKTCDILVACANLADLTVCVHNLGLQEGAMFYHAVFVAVKAAASRANRTVAVNRESKKEYEGEMRVRELAEEEYQRICEAEGYAYQNWADGDKEGSYEDYLAAD